MAATQQECLVQSNEVLTPDASLDGYMSCCFQEWPRFQKHPYEHRTLAMDTGTRVYSPVCRTHQSPTQTCEFHYRRQAKDRPAPPAQQAYLPAPMPSLHTGKLPSF